jgi:4-hydroxybenzoate polyprenyltransferase
VTSCQASYSPSDAEDNKTSPISREDEGKDNSDGDHIVLEHEAPRLFVAASASSSSSERSVVKSRPETILSLSGQRSQAPAASAKTKPTVWSCRKDLWSMCRPSNFMGVVVFHLLGAFLGIRAISPAEATGMSELLASIIVKPQMMLVLLTLLLTSSTSMLVNDYYDTRSGVDAHKLKKPLVRGSVPTYVVKRFLSYLYAVLLLSLTVVPGVAARLTIMLGAMVTYWYTENLKPITWLKNFTCSSLIALAPLTSGAAAMELVSGGSGSRKTILNALSLWRLFAMLFFGFVGREIMMDINDVVDDRLHRVRTVPVKYGRKFASNVVLACTVFMSGFSLVGWTSGRQLALAALGSLAQTWRAFEVTLTQGEDTAVVDRAIEEGKLSVMFLLASYV